MPTKKKKVILMKHNKFCERCILNQMKPIFATYFMHILQGQASGFDALMSRLNSSKDLQFF